MNWTHFSCFSYLHIYCCRSAVQCQDHLGFLFPSPFLDAVRHYIDAVRHQAESSEKPNKKKEKTPHQQSTGRNALALTLVFRWGKWRRRPKRTAAHITSKQIPANAIGRLRAVPSGKVDREIQASLQGQAPVPVSVRFASVSIQELAWPSALGAGKKLPLALSHTMVWLLASRPRASR